MKGEINPMISIKNLKKNKSSKKKTLEEERLITLKKNQFDWRIV